MTQRVVLQDSVDLVPGREQGPGFGLGIAMQGLAAAGGDTGRHLDHADPPVIVAELRIREVSRGQWLSTGRLIHGASSW